MRSSLPRQIKNKLNVQLSVLAWLLKNAYLVLFGVTFGALAIASVYPLISLSICVLGTGLLALKIEEGITRVWLLPPLFLAVIPHLVGLGVGLPLYIVGINNQYDEALLRTLIAYLIGFLAMLAGYRLLNVSSTQRIVLAEQKLNDPNIRKNLAAVGIICYVLWILDTWAGLISGASDRSFAGDFTADNPFGWWTVFRSVRNSAAVGLILVPLIYQQIESVPRFALMFSFCVQLTIAFASGSREYLIVPVTYVLLGAYIFAGRKTQIQKLVLLLIPFAIFIFYFVYLFRSTETFGQSRASSLVSRLSAIGETRSVVLGAEENFLTVTGAQLLDVSDPIIFLETPRSHPFSGWENIDAILWTWVPNFLVRDRPSLIDGNEIVSKYTGILHARSFSKISLRADLYRRFGVVGIVAGMFAFGSCLAIYWRFMYSKTTGRYPEVGILGILLLFTYYRTGLENQTLFTTWWQWSYDIPKNLLFLFAILFIVRAPNSISKTK